VVGKAGCQSGEQFPNRRTVNLAGTPASTGGAALADEVFAGWTSQPRGGRASREGRSLPGNHEREKPPSLDDPFAWLASGQPFQAGPLGG
jgi:hypothetical protein